MPRELKKLSIVTPFYNESEGIGGYFNTTISILETLDCDWEIIALDDGSEDATYELLCEENEKDSRVKVLRLSRNFGKDVALTAGFLNARGDAVIIMDADMQDPPELITDLVKVWMDGKNHVQAKRRARPNDTWMKLLTARGFYWGFNLFSTVKIPGEVADYQILDRSLIDRLKKYPERRRFMRGLASSVSEDQIYIEHDRPERARGKSKWGLMKLASFAWESTLAYSRFPFRFFALVGCFSSIVAFLLWFLSLIGTLTEGGLETWKLALVFLSGLNLILLSFIAEYANGIYLESKRRPLYHIRSAIGFESEIEEF
jgi:glycosyltransferase involved in cell wall biosynthesis